jgi:hypothetical protein
MRGSATIRGVGPTSVGAILAIASSCVAQISFVDATGSAGLGAYQMAEGLIAGVAAADFDGDGDVDLFVPTRLGLPDQLYVNQGDGTFVEDAAARGLGGLENSRVAIWLDHDADRDLDLVVVADRHLKKYVPQVHTFTLYEQLPGGTFADVTAGSGLDVLIWDPMAFDFNPGNQAGGLAAGDLDGDGDLDLVLTYWAAGGRTHVFRAAGPGLFVDDTDASLPGAGTASHWQPIIHDFDRDGLMDLYVAVDFGPNRLWRNLGGGVHANVAPALGVDNLMNDMGLALGDPDNDGDLDLFITNIYDPINFPGRHNVLFRNDTAAGALAFTEISESVGVDNGDWGWGVTWIDADMDGRIDLAHTNGMSRPEFEHDRSRLFHNTPAGDPGASFDDIAQSSGFYDDDLGMSLVALDADRDGDLDLVQTCNPGPLRLWLNRTGAEAPGGERFNTGAWLVVRPRACGPNTHAIGAVVRAKIGAELHTRLIAAGTSSLGQEPAEAHFGLGDASAVDSVTIEWPGGASTILAGVALNQMITVVQDGCPGDVDRDCDVDVFDFAALAALFGQPVPAHADADVEPNGEIDIFDFATLAGSFGCAAP